MSGKDPKKFNVALTRKHSDYYGEETDPALVRILARYDNSANNPPVSEGDRNSDDGTVDIVVDATEVRNIRIGTQSNLLEIAPENVEIIHAGNGECVC